MSETIAVTKRRRGFFGHVFRLLFFAFNGLMVVWLVLGMKAVGDIQATSQAEQAGRAIGGAMGFGAIVFIWLAGAAVLGGLMLATRGKMVTVTTTRN